MSWLDWSGLDTDPDFLHQVKTLLRFRRELPYLSKESYLHGRAKNATGWHNIEWLNPAGNRMKLNQWHNDRTLTLLLPGMEENQPCAVAIMFNASDEALDFSLPAMAQDGHWVLVFQTAAHPTTAPGQPPWTMQPRSIACAEFGEPVSGDDMP